MQQSMHPITKWLSLAGLVAVTAWAPPLHAAAGVKVAMLPASQTVAPGGEFDISIEVTRAGSNFNGFDLYIGYDPAALTLLSHAEGTYFVAGCSNRFHMWRPGADRDTVNDAYLCSGTSVTGPGQIYKLHFRASLVPQVTTVRFLPGLQFYNAGLYVNPDSSTDAAVGIGMAAGVGGPATARISRLRAAPNPFRVGTLLTIESDRGGNQELVITDLQGRVVRRLQSGTFDAGTRVVKWDGRNDSGRVAAPGVYLALVRGADRTIRTRLTLLH